MWLLFPRVKDCWRSKSAWLPIKFPLRNRKTSFVSMTLGAISFSSKFSQQAPSKRARYGSFCAHSVPCCSQYGGEVRGLWAAHFTAIQINEPRHRRGESHQQGCAQTNPIRTK